MIQQDVAVVYMPVSSTAEYFTGINWPIPNPTEHDRPGDWVSGMYLGQTGGVVIIEPRMGSASMVSQISGKPWIDDLRVLGEPEDYGAVMTATVQQLAGTTAGRIAVAEHAWAKSVLQLQRSLEDTSLINAHDLIWPMRMVKDKGEQDLMRRAANVVDEAYELILEKLRLGMTTGDISTVVDQVLFDLGADWTSFHTGIYMAGLPDYHGPTVFDNDGRVLERGGAIAFDFGVLLDGYCSDFGRTVFIGEPTRERREVYDLVIRSQETAIAAMVDQNITAEQLDEVARSIIREAGYGPQFIHRLGHSIGKDVHEPPFLLDGDDTLLLEGMFFTIEPSIVMDDGCFIRVEDVVMVGESGGINYNQTSHELRVLDL